jgi:hypothetical protein
MAKRAICVGIDTYSTPNVPPLHGCVQDAQNMARLLAERFAFSASDVKQLHNTFATKESILRSIDWLRSVSSPGDHACIYIAAHGTNFPDRSGNEADGLDELIVTHDHSWQFSLLRDDEIADLLARFPATVSIVCIFDTSHALAPGAQGRCVIPPGDLPPIGWARSRNLSLRPRFRNRRPDDLPGLLFLSACGEHEVARELSGPTGFGGAFTGALIQAMGSSPEASWESIHGQCAAILRSQGIHQTPQLHGAPAMRTQTLFGAVASASSRRGDPPRADAWGAHSPNSTPQSQPTWGQSPAVAAVATGAAAAGLGTMNRPFPQQSLATQGDAMMQGPQSRYQPTVPTPVDNALAEFKPEDYTVRLCNTIFKVLPFAPSAMPYGNLGDAVQALSPSPSAQILSKAEQYARAEPVTKTLWVANAIDTGDAGIAVYSGVRSAVVLFFGENKSDALETDPQQAVDAVLKLLGLSYIIYRLFPGSIPDRVRSFYALPAGQALAMYYASVEVALPFADNIVSSGGHFVHNMVQRYGSDAAGKLQSLIGADDLANSQGILASVMAPMESAVQRVTPFATQIAEAAKTYVPGALNVVDKAAGIVATGADAMPVYRYLVARLTAEACAQYATNT